MAYVWATPSWFWKFIQLLGCWNDVEMIFWLLVSNFLRLEGSVPSIAVAVLVLELRHLNSLKLSQNEMFGKEIFCRSKDTLLIISSKSKILDLTDGTSSDENAQLTAYPWARSVPSTNIAISALNICKSFATKLIDSMHRFVDFYIVKVGTISLRGTIYISHKQIFRLFWFTQS